MSETSQGGALMGAEIAESAAVFRRAVAQAVALPLGLADIRAIYTIARGFSDAAATVLAYEIMRVLSLPVTSLPPSVFSLGGSIAVHGALALAISQSRASEDLVSSLRGMRAVGAHTLAITNVAGSPLAAEADLTLPIGAGAERAVPATKSVIGAIGTGLGLLAALRPDYRSQLEDAANAFDAPVDLPQVEADALRVALLDARHLFVVGRGSGLGAAQELALKIRRPAPSMLRPIPVPKCYTALYRW